MQEQVTSEAKMIEEALAERFGATCPVDPALPGLDELARVERELRISPEFMVPWAVVYLVGQAMLWWRVSRRSPL